MDGLSDCQNKNAIKNYILILQDLCSYYKKDAFHIEMIFGGMVGNLQI